jgi:hypothetical protein
VGKLSSGRWYVRYRTGSGERVSAPETFVTKTEATRWLSTVEADQARGLWVDPSAGKITLGDYSRTWLLGKVRIALRSRELYALQLRLHILPAIQDGGTPPWGICSSRSSRQSWCEPGTPLWLQRAARP